MSRNRAIRVVPVYDTVWVLDSIHTNTEFFKNKTSILFNASIPEPHYYSVRLPKIATETLISSNGFVRADFQTETNSRWSWTKCKVYSCLSLGARIEVISLISPCNPVILSWCEDCYFCKLLCFIECDPIFQYTPETTESASVGTPNLK